METVDINLILQIVVLVVGAAIAYFVRKGWIDRKTVEDTKTVAGTLAGAIDKFKDVDPDAAQYILREIITSIGDDKATLDEFLKKMNLNKPKKPSSLPEALGAEKPNVDGGDVEEKPEETTDES